MVTHEEICFGVDIQIHPRIVLLGCIYNSIAEFICILIEPNLYTLDSAILQIIHSLVIR